MMLQNVAHWLAILVVKFQKTYISSLHCDVDAGKSAGMADHYPYTLTFLSDSLWVIQFLRREDTKSLNRALLGTHM